MLWKKVSTVKVRNSINIDPGTTHVPFPIMENQKRPWYGNLYWQAIQWSTKNYTENLKIEQHEPH